MQAAAASCLSQSFGRLEVLTCRIWLVRRLSTHRCSHRRAAHCRTGRGLRWRPARRACARSPRQAQRTFSRLQTRCVAVLLCVGTHRENSIPAVESRLGLKTKPAWRCRLPNGATEIVRSPKSTPKRRLRRQRGGEARSERAATPAPAPPAPADRFEFCAAINNAPHFEKQWRGRRWCTGRPLWMRWLDTRRRLGSDSAAAAHRSHSARLATMPRVLPDIGHQEVDRPVQTQEEAGQG